MTALLRSIDPATALEAIGAVCLITAGAIIHPSLALFVAGVACFAATFTIEAGRRRGSGDADRGVEPQRGQE